MEPITYPSQVRPADFDTWADDESVKDMTPTTLRMNLRLQGDILGGDAEAQPPAYLAEVAAAALLYAAELLRREQNGQSTRG